MMSLLMKAVRGLLSSKKAMMAFLSVLVWLIGKVSLGWDTDILLPIVAPLWGYIAAQAGADWGKEAHGGEAPTIMDAVRGLLSSRKAMMAILSALVWGFGKAGLGWDAEMLLPLVAPLWGYIAAQAGADFGKEAKKLKAANTTKAEL